MRKGACSEAFGIAKVHVVEKTCAEKKYFAELREKRAQVRNVRAAVLAQYADTGSLFRCGRCGSDKDVGYDAQVRRAMDEGMVYDCTCRKCGFQFRVS